MNVTKKYYIPRLSPIDLIFFRLGGPGLGNLLFPISRALLDARKADGVFINGTFPQLKFGPVIRMERDKRAYRREFTPQSLRKRVQRLLLTFRDSTTEQNMSQETDCTVFYYAGLGKFFYPLLGWEEVIREFLYERKGPVIRQNVVEGLCRESTWQQQGDTGKHDNQQQCRSSRN